MTDKKFNKRILQTFATRLQPSNNDVDKRTVTAALSKGATIKRMFGTEKLIISKESVNLERAVDGLPLLFDHNRAKPIGRVDNVRIEGDVIRGELVFSNNKLAKSIYRDVSEGFLKDVSIGYRINEFAETDEGIEATNWSLLEASVITIPAEIDVGVNRSIDNEGAPMSDKTKEEIAAAAVASYKEQQVTRSAEISEVFKNYTGEAYADLKVRAISDDSLTIDKVRAELLDLVSQQNVSASGGVATFGGEDEADKMKRGIEESLLVRVGSCRDDKTIKDIRSNEFNGFTMVDIARTCLEKNGKSVRGMSNMQIMGEAFSMRDIHGVVDFPNILGNVSNASMQLAYEEAPETWRSWSRVGNLSDFKLTDRPNLSAFDDLPEVPDKDEYTDGSFSDLKESIQLATYGKLFKLTRQAMINDSLDGLGRIPAAMGRAAARTVGTLAYNVLLENNPMNQDGLPVFDAGHNNDNDSGGSAPTNGLVEQGILQMALQQDPSLNATLGISPAFLVVPTSMASAARILMAAEYEPGTAPGNLQPNPHRGLMQVISEHRLERSTDQPWFMIASPSAAEVVEVAFLNGNDSPSLEQEDPFTWDGVTFKVRIDAAAQAIDFRGMQRFSLIE